MQVIEDIHSLKQLIGSWKTAKQTVAFVPTMGNLHEGHLELVKEGAKLADRVVVSIFVNPSQFGPHEDFQSYPRTLSQDKEKLTRLQVDSVFIPDVNEIYPNEAMQSTWVEVGGLSQELCGRFRPGHFRGVATVVNKLFNIVQADIAVFGKKDLQQVRIIQQMVNDLFIPTKIVEIPTIRDIDGLALSSRNQYLDATQRRLATELFKQLLNANHLLLKGQNPKDVQIKIAEDLHISGFDVEYVEVRRTQDLAIPGPDDRDLVTLIAARLGSTRLIDNLSMEDASIVLSKQPLETTD